MRAAYAAAGAAARLFARRSGVWVTAVPLPSPQAYSFSYALRYPAGVVVVDLGRNSDNVRDAFCGGLARPGWSQRRTAVRLGAYLRTVIALLGALPSA